MNNLENAIMKEVEELEVKVKDGQELDIDEIKALENKIDSLTDVDANMQYLLKHKVLKLRRKSIKGNEKITKWDLFCEDMEEIGEKSILELIDYINERKDDTISKEELADLEARYNAVLPVILEKLSSYDRERAMKEFNKKIKLFSNRLSRVIEEDFGSWIKQLRLAKGYSLKQLEKASGVTASYIHRIEGGSRKTPSVPVAESLAIALGVSPDEFLRKLNLISSTPVDRNIGLGELIAKNSFTINDNPVSVEQKNALLALINTIIETPWTEQTKFSESGKILTKIDEFKSTLNK